MLGDMSGISKIYIITGRTDMRKSFDGLMSMISDTYRLDPYSKAMYLFCGRNCSKLRLYILTTTALYFFPKDWKVSMAS